MSDYRSIMLDANGEEIAPPTVNVQTQPDPNAGAGAQIRDLSAERAALEQASRDINDPGRLERGGTEFDIMTDRVVEQAEIVRSLAAAGRPVPSSMRDSLVTARNDLAIQYTSIGGNVQDPEFVQLSEFLLQTASAAK